MAEPNDREYLDDDESAFEDPEEDDAFAKLEEEDAEERRRDPLRHRI